MKFEDFIEGYKNRQRRIVEDKQESPNLRTLKRGEMYGLEELLKRYATNYVGTQSWITYQINLAREAIKSDPAFHMGVIIALDMASYAFERLEHE